MHTEEKSSTRKILVTGGAGFIGSHFVDVLVQSGFHVTVLDSLTYAGSLENLAASIDKINFIRGDIRDSQLVENLLRDGAFHSIVNLAAQTHVDRSIQDPFAFSSTNVEGTVCLLNALRTYEADHNCVGKTRFVQMSTDEVFGSLGSEGVFTELSAYAPNSPYSASKAAGDQFVRAFKRTYGLNTVIVYGSNNFGSRQHPEKLIPKTIKYALAGRKIPVYGDGKNVRSWIAVYDQCEGLRLALELGRTGESYCVSGAEQTCEKTNLEVVQSVCAILDREKPKSKGSYRDQITYVKDRPGHDFRYAMANKKASQELGYIPKFDFTNALESTVLSYLL